MKFVLLFTLFSITIYKGFSQLPETEKQYYACYGSHDGKIFLDADCPASMVIAIKEVYVGTKPNFLGCPQETSSPFMELLELTCCSPDDGDDCIAPYSVKTYFHPACTGKNVCPKLQAANQPTSCEGGSFMTNSNYMYMDYYCIPEIKIGQFDNAAISFGSSVMCYLQSAGYPVSKISGGSIHTCSVETDCLETVTISLIDIRLMDSAVTCEQRLTITDGSSTHIISCTENNDYVINKEYYYSQGNYLRLELKSTLTTDDGYIWIGIQASGSVSIQCPAKVIQNPCTPTTTTTTTTTITGDSTTSGQQVLDTTEPGTTEDKPKTQSRTTVTPATVEPGIEAGTIAGIVVAVFGIIIVGILICLCCVYKKKKQKKSEEKTTITVQGSKPQSALTVSGLTFDTEAPKLQSGLLGERFKVNNAPVNIKSSLPPIGTKMILTNDQHSTHGGVSPSPLLRLSKSNETSLALIDKPIPPIRPSLSSGKQLTPPIETKPWNVNQRHSLLETKLSPTKQLGWSETSTGLATTKQRTPFRLEDEDTNGTESFNSGLATQKFATGKLPDRGSDSSPWDSDDPSLATTTYHAKSLGGDGITSLRHGTSNIGFEGLKHETNHIKSRFLDDKNQYSENTYSHFPDTPPEIEADNIMSSVGTTDNSENTVEPFSMKSLVGRDPSTGIVMDHSDHTHISGFDTHPRPVFRPLREYSNNTDEDNKDSHSHNDPVKEQLVEDKHTKHKKKKKKRRILQKEEMMDDSKLDMNSGYQHTSRKQSKHKRDQHENITSTRGEGEEGAIINTPTVLFVQEAISSKRKKKKTHKSHNKQRDSDVTSVVKHIANGEEDDHAQLKKERKHGKKKSKHRDKQEEYSGIDTNISSFDKTWSAIETGNTWSSDDNIYTTYM